MYVAVTGSTGKLGRAAVAALRAAKHRVVGLDINVPIAPAQSILCDCTDFGQVMGALSGIDITGKIPDAVLHLAGIPMPGLATDHQTFEVNIRSTYNVFSACARLGIKKAVWASSETIFGLPFDEPPAFVPIDETHPDRPGWSYALAKQLCETMADSFALWNPEMSIMSLRFSNVYAADDYKQLASIQANPTWRKMNLWSYVDAEDAGDACRIAIDADLTGHHKMIIAAADTLMQEPSAELAAQYFPAMPMKSEMTDNQSFLSSARAGTLIGYRALHSWRNRIGKDG